jgi:methyl-accepting chemotaxis protein
VNKAVMAMDDTTQQNAALVEQLTSASQSMKTQAQELLRHIDIFKFDETGRRHDRQDGSSKAQDRESMTGGSFHRAVDWAASRPQEPVGVAGQTNGSRSAGMEEFDEF